jgi:TetR/AcrR family acrAB operon transcriptional repressor
MSGKRSSGDLREKLLASAIRLFAEQGYDATTLDQIATDAGATKGAVYWHFKDKADLFGHVMRERTDRLEANVTTAMDAATTAPEKIRAFFDSSFQFSQENPHFAVLLGRLRAAPVVEIGSGVVEELRTAYRDAREIISQSLRQGQADGTFREAPVAETAAVLLAIADGLVLQWVLDFDAFDLIEVGKVAAAKAISSLAV